MNDKEAGHMHPGSWRKRVALAAILGAALAVYSADSILVPGCSGPPIRWPFPGLIRSLIRRPNPRPEAGCSSSWGAEFRCVLRGKSAVAARNRKPTGGRHADASKRNVHSGCDPDFKATLKGKRMPKDGKIDRGLNTLKKLP